MKPKDNNANSYKTYLFTKGLSFLILLFFAGNIFAQKIFKNSITTNSSDIFVEFNIIDQVEIIVIEGANQIVVTAESEDNKSPNFILEDKNGIVFIRSIENYLQGNNKEEIDKLCSIQPIYTSYQIILPTGKNVYVSFSQGNFYSSYFKGKLNLKLDDGIVKLNHFEGMVKVQINGGNVFCYQIENTKINVNSNLGIVSSNLMVENPFQDNNKWEVVYGKNINEFSVNAISANIYLEAK